MKKQIMQVALLNDVIQADTDGFINLNSLALAGNKWRMEHGMAIYQLNSFLGSQYLKDYIPAASLVWGIPEDKFLKKTKTGKLVKHEGHVSIALLLAEQMSPFIHATVHKVFIDGRLLENRLYGGEEFKRVNRAIDDYFPSPSGDNTGRYINVSKWIRSKCNISKPDDEEVETWNQKAADMIAQEKRASMLNRLADYMEMGLIKDWSQLKEVIEKL